MKYGCIKNIMYSRCGLPTVHNVQYVILRVMVRLPSPARPPLLEREGARPKIGGKFCTFFIYLLLRPKLRGGKKITWGSLAKAFWARSVRRTPQAPVIYKVAYILWAWSMHRNFQAQVITAINKRWKTNS